MRRITVWVIGALVLAMLTACGSGDEHSGPDAVATTPILGELARKVAEPCDVSVAVIMPPGTDPHEFQPSARQAAKVATGLLVIENGGGYEQGLTDALSKGEDANGKRIFRKLTALDYADALDNGGFADPHFWLDPQRMGEVANGMAAELSQVAPNKVDCLADSAQTVAADLGRLDAKIEGILSVIPKGRRKLVTSHDAFEYFAEHYGFEVVGSLTSPQSEAEPSPAQIAALAATMKDDGIPAVVGVTGEFEEVAQTLAEEAGGAKVVDLYAETLADPPANTYASMMEANAQRLADALK